MKVRAICLKILILFLISMPGYSKDSGELVIYCGTTMMKSMVELAKEFEKSHGRKVHFIKGGSGKLLKLLLKNKNGDLYLPGSDSYIEKMKTEHPGLVTASAHVGFNQAALLVKEGNPKGIAPDLNVLHDGQLRVIIGSHERSSVGKEAKKILSKHGTFDQVKEKAVVTMNSSSLVNAIKADKADVSINWFAISTWPENKDQVDALKISDEYAKKKKLVLAVLKDSKQPDYAKAFLELAASDRGKEAFKKYGLGTD